MIKISDLRTTAADEFRFLNSLSLQTLTGFILNNTHILHSERVEVIRRELITDKRISILNRCSRCAVAVAVLVAKLLDDLPEFASSVVQEMVINGCTVDLPDRRIVH